MITITKRAAEEINLSTHDPDSQGYAYPLCSGSNR